VFVGDAGVGKTALLQTFFGLTALNSQGIMHVQPLPPTLRVHDDFKRVMVIGGQHVMLHCWDVAGTDCTNV
jgi:GTPase SAR1 family protein